MQDLVKKISNYHKLIIFIVFFLLLCLVLFAFYIKYQQNQAWKNKKEPKAQDELSHLVLEDINVIINKLETNQLEQDNLHYGNLKHDFLVSSNTDYVLPAKDNLQATIQNSIADSQNKNKVDAESILNKSADNSFNNISNVDSIDEYVDSVDDKEVLDYILDNQNKPNRDKHEARVISSKADHIQNTREQDFYAALQSSMNVSVNFNSFQDTNVLSSQEGVNRANTNYNLNNTAANHQSAATVNISDSYASYDALRQSKYKNNSQVETVTTPYILRQGTIIPALLLTAINSDIKGQIVAQVTDDVLDTPRGDYVLIPKGSRIIGQYATYPSMGQQRLMLAFNRLIFPDGKALDLGAMPVSDTDGYAGLSAEVDNHYLSLFTNSVLLASIGTTITLANNDDYYKDNGNVNVQNAYNANLAQIFGQSVTRILEQSLNISPSLTIDSGYLFNVTLIEDFEFNKPYESYDYTR